MRYGLSTDDDRAWAHQTPSCDSRPIWSGIRTHCESTKTTITVPTARHRR